MYFKVWSHSNGIRNLFNACISFRWLISNNSDRCRILSFNSCLHFLFYFFKGILYAVKQWWFVYSIMFQRLYLSSSGRALSGILAFSLKISEFFFSWRLHCKTQSQRYLANKNYFCLKMPCNFLNIHLILFWIDLTQETCSTDSKQKWFKWASKG